MIISKVNISVKANPEVVMTIPMCADSVDKAEQIARRIAEEITNKQYRIVCVSYEDCCGVEHSF